MKIAIVCYPTFGGSGVVATELGISLAKKGHEIHFITYKQPVRLALLDTNIYFHQVHVPNYPLFHYQPYELALSGKLVDTIKLYGIDILHVHYAIPHAYAAYMAKKMLFEQGINIPIVTTLHGTDITLVGKHPFYKSAVTFSINNSDIITTVSESLKEDTLNIFDIKKEILVVPNFIDMSKYPSDTTDCKRKLLANENEHIITHVSNFRKVKRIRDIIKIFHKVQQQLNARLIMIGEGPEEEVAEQMCDDFGITDNVVFLGNTDEIDKILCFTDIFLLPSERESFGLAALEAMANGVPVVSSDSGGLPELNIDNHTGYLCKVGDITDMTDKICGLLSNPTKLKKFKENAYNRAMDFDLSKIISIYEDTYYKGVTYK